MRPTFLSLLKADATREQLEDWCRGQTQSFTAGYIVTCRVLGKYLMHVSHQDNALTPHLVLDGIWEPWITMAIVRHIRPGMRCMDVGACYGYYALLMADIVGKDGYVEAWEPVWSDYVKSNADINGLAVTTRRHLMGTQEGKEFECSLPRPYATRYNAGDMKLTPWDGKRSVLPRVSMQRPVAESFDFIKIDVEGAEADVWQALEGVRAASPKLTVCMEFTPEKHENPDNFLLSLVADGFQLGTVGHDGVPRHCHRSEALVPDTGGFRMLWLTRNP